MEDIKQLALYVADTGCTVRQAAEVFGVSKSTVHKELTRRLRYISPQLFARVAEVLERNKNERHIRGGNSTRLMYIRRRSEKGN